MAKLTNYYFLTPTADNLNFIDFSLNYGTLSTVGESIVFNGTDKVDTLFVRPGLVYDLTSTGGGADKIYLSGNLADYRFFATNTQLTMTRFVGDLLETVYVARGSVNNFDQLIFANGWVNSNELYNAVSQNLPRPSPNLSERSTAPAPGSAAHPDTVLNATVKAFANGGSTVGKVGDTFATTRPGISFVVTGSHGIDTVYVANGANVQATALGGSIDLIYMRGNWADYTKAVDSVTKTIVFTRELGTITETVTVSSGSQTQFDRLIFADGAVSTINANNTLKINPSVPIAQVPGYDPKTVTPLYNDQEATDALNTIKTAADANSATDETPNASVYQTAGVQGVTASNLAAINSALNSTGVDANATDTSAKVQTIVDAYNLILIKANDVDNLPGNNNDDSTIALLANHYTAVGANIGDAASSTGKGPQTLTLLNDIVGGKQRADVDSVGEINDLAKIANALQTLASVSNGGAVNTALTVDDLSMIGLNTSGLNPFNVKKFWADIAASNDLGSETNTLQKLQALIGTPDNTPPKLQIDQTDATIAGDGVINSAERNAGVLLSGTTEAGRPVTIATSTGNPLTVTASSTGAWSATVPAANLPNNGNVTFTVSSTDAFGNSATVTRTASVDTTGPYLQIDQTDATIAGDGVINSAECNAGVLLSGTTEAGRPVTIATSTGNPLTVTASSTGAWSATVPAANLPNNGNVTFTVSSTDAFGNSATVTRTASVDTTGPDSFSAARLDLVQTILDNDPSLRYSYATGSFYQKINPPNNAATFHWSTANTIATNKVLHGHSGHLVHVNSASENTEVHSIFGNKDGWLGGSGKDHLTWKWYHSDALGETFSSGATSQFGHYVNWGPGSPNGREDYLYMATNSTWDDGGQYGVSGRPELTQALVEWEGSKVLNTQTYYTTQSIRVSSSAVGKAYLVNAANAVSSVSDITRLDAAQWHSIDLTGTSTIVLAAEDFENSTTGWKLISNNAATAGPTNGFLGRPSGAGIGQDNIGKTYDFGSQNANRTVTIDFDLYEMDSWDGELFKVFVNGQSTSVQSYHYAGSSIKDGGIDMNNWTANAWSEERHHYTLQARLDSNGRFTLGFGSLLDEDVSNESWGIDNLVITTPFSDSSSYNASMSLWGLSEGEYKLYTADAAGNLTADHNTIKVKNPELIVNGGFEDSSSAWTGNNLYWVGPKEGYSAAMLLGAHENNGISTVQQTIQTVAGARYAVRYNYGTSNGNAEHTDTATSAGLVMTVHDGTTGQMLTELRASKNFAAYGGVNGKDFTAASSSTVIKFQSMSMADGVDVFLDNVSVKLSTSTPPVVIDLNRDNHLDYGHVLMDVNGDGQLDHTRWAGAADGVLVWDKYQDGLVHDHTQYAFAQYGGKTDLEGLAAQFDTQRDGVFDAQDALFSAFKVWRDANQNGISDAGEVRSLADWGLSAIDLVSDGIERQPVSGVLEAGRTVATGPDGSAVLVADVAFEFSTPSGVMAQAAPQIHPPADPGADRRQLQWADVMAAPQQTLAIGGSANDGVYLSAAAGSNSSETFHLPDHSFNLWHNGTAHGLLDAQMLQATRVI